MNGSKLIATQVKEGYRNTQGKVFSLRKFKDACDFQLTSIFDKINRTNCFIRNRRGIRTIFFANVASRHIHSTILHYIH